jgi:hypothetical protein
MGKGGCERERGEMGGIWMDGARHGDTGDWD